MPTFISSRWLKKSPRDVLDDENAHELLDGAESIDTAPAKWTQTRNASWITTRVKIIAILSVAVTILAGLSISRQYQKIYENIPEADQVQWPWQALERLDGYFHGISELVKASEWEPQNGHAVQGTASNGTITVLESRSSTPRASNFELFPYEPALRDVPPGHGESLPSSQQCFLDSADTIPAPSIYAFKGITQHSVTPMFGSYSLLGLADDVCFDRYGRYGPYGLGYSSKIGGTGRGMHGDQSLTDPVWSVSGQINWSSIDLGDAQWRCADRNTKRFHLPPQKIFRPRSGLLDGIPEVDWQEYRSPTEDLGLVPRTVVVLRAWEGAEYTQGVKLYIRSLVNELALYSGGEYDVHLLVEVKNTSRPIWTSEADYEKALNDLVPEEFRSMATLWSQPLMQLIYPGPFEPQFHEHGGMYPAMRSMHFALQWFMMQHPEYEYFWNWEMDIRYVGHWYELFNRARVWAKQQPRKHAWSRSARYYISALYEDWEAFSRDTEERVPDDIIHLSDFKPNPGPGHKLDEDEEADFITFNPIFNPRDTFWNRALDVTGYDTNQPIPERRSAIVAASRFSRRLLLAMHYENYHNRHSMASEMFPPTMALHHGLKAVHAPHPVYLERDWTPAYAAEIFNGGPYGDTGNYKDSVMGYSSKGNHMALQQSTYFYDAKFPEIVYWRWGGYMLYQYNNEGGARDEMKKSKDGVRKGRMCLRSTLFHPIKFDEGRAA